MVHPSERLFARDEHREGLAVGEQAPELTLEYEHRPSLRYYFHGTSAGNAENASQHGFNYKTGHPTLSASLGYCLREWTDADRLEKKGRIPPTDGRNVVLVIEPGDDNLIRPNNKSRPKVSSDEIVVRGQWFNDHQAIFPADQEEVLSEKIPGRLSPDTIRMVLEPTAELKALLSSFQKELDSGHGNEDEYITRLLEYLNSGEGISLDKVNDKKELAENIIKGEMQQHVISTIRRLWLNVEAYQGRRVQHVKQGQPGDFNLWSPDKIKRVVANIRALPLRDSFLEQYRDSNLPGIEGKVATL